MYKDVLDMIELHKQYKIYMWDLWNPIMSLILKYIRNILISRIKNYTKTLWPFQFYGVNSGSSKIERLFYRLKASPIILSGIICIV